jgi:hypothetical protein
MEKADTLEDHLIKVSITPNGDTTIANDPSLRAEHVVTPLGNPLLIRHALPENLYAALLANRPQRSANGYSISAQDQRGRRNQIYAVQYWRVDTVDALSKKWDQNLILALAHQFDQDVEKSFFGNSTGAIQRNVCNKEGVRDIYTLVQFVETPYGIRKRTSKANICGIYKTALSLLVAYLDTKSQQYNVPLHFGMVPGEDIPEKKEFGILLRKYTQEK